MSSPAIQSVVREYTILYSNRVHQKDKKWLDGILKYYEFNRKLEIHDEDQASIISTDFIVGNKQASNMLSDNNQFTLTNGKYIVEILEPRRSYTRVLKNVAESGLSLVDINFDEQKVRTIVEPVKLSQNIRPRPIGLRKVSKSQRMNSQMKESQISPSMSARKGGTQLLSPRMDIRKEASVSNASDFSDSRQTPRKSFNNINPIRHTPQRTPLSYNPVTSATATRIFQIPPLKIVPLPYTPSKSAPPAKSKSKSSPNIGSIRTKAGAKEITLDDLYVPSSKRPRIPPRSSNHFQHIYTEEDVVEIKKEKLCVSQKDVESADIIYDLSDYERDIKFDAMMKEVRVQRQSEGKTRGKKSNDSVDYGLSSSSDFDDIDD